MNYKYYIGIDISKNFFDLSCYGEPKNHHFSNDSDGFKQLLKALKPKLSNALVVVEATGGYEKNLILFLSKQGVAIHLVQPLKSSHYIRSPHVYGKNDMLNAAALARYRAERNDQLAIFTPSDELTPP